jgi:hypothetical protein
MKQVETSFSVSISWLRAKHSDTRQKRLQAGWNDFS